MPKTKPITSIKDPRVVEARELTSASARARKRKYLLEVAQSIQWALSAHLPVEHVFYHAAISDDPLLIILREKCLPCYAVTDGILKKISDTSYLVPYIGVAFLPRERSAQDAIGDVVIVLDRVLDHGNIGTIIPTASAFGVRDMPPPAQIWISTTRRSSLRLGAKYLT